MKALTIFLVCMPALLWSQRYQLTAPRIIVDSIFFRQKANVRMEFDLEGASITYTSGYSLPGENSPIYTTPFTVDSSTVIWAQSRHPEFMLSSMVSKQLIKVAAPPDSFQLLTLPDAAYRGRLDSTLFDLQKGGRDLHDGRWLGFNGDSTVVEVKFKAAVLNKVMLISTLSDPGAWIFPPQRVDVFGKTGNKDWVLIGGWSARPDQSWKDNPAKYDNYLRVLLRPVSVDQMRIRITPYGPLPEGHPGAGKPAWLFLDEIVFQ